MKRSILALLVLMATILGTLFTVHAADPTHKVRLNGHTFTLPAGFEIELIAGPPLVDRPIVADFDEQGRLYVADSSGSNEKVQDQLQKKPHRIVRLEDADGDGKFDRRTVFADKMMFPEGCLWFDGSLYVSAPPSIWKLTDADGDGVAEKRVEWLKQTLTNCANDLHGPYLGPDGWIYWAKGAFAKQTYERPGKPPFVTRAAHLFRARPDGSGIEPVMTGGMDNPVDVVFTPGGERVFTTTFLQHPGGGKRDGLIHAIYGGVYGKDHDPIYEHPWSGPSLMPVLTHFGAAAPCGLTRYESAAFGQEYRDNLFACQFNMHKVSRHVLTPRGSTFDCKDSDFLVSDNLDFHPTDVLEDADGSLIVVDTGGWYKLCCPSSQLHKPDILGGIYRVRRAGAAKVDDARGRKLAWGELSSKQLADRLGDPRPAVRKRAMQTLAAKNVDAEPVLADVLRSSDSVVARRNALWTATRIDGAAARAVARPALNDPDETVRQVAIHSAGVRRDREALPQLLSLLKRESFHNRRAAAEALGRIGDKSAVPALLEAAGEPVDRTLEHSLTFALIEIADAEGTAAGLKSDNVRTRRAALVALDQMGGKHLAAESVAAELSAKDSALKENAWWIAGRHPEWGGTLAGFLRQRLAAKEVTPAERDDLVRQLARFAQAASVQKSLAEWLRDPAAERETRRTLLRAMAQAGVRQTPEIWVTDVAQILTGGDADLIPDAVAAARAFRVAKQHPKRFDDGLLKVGRDEKVPPAVRLNALAAMPGGLPKVESPLFAFLLAQLGPDQSVAMRTEAADVLSKARLKADQLVELTGSLKSAGPVEVDRLLDAFAQTGDEKVGHPLIAALKASPARSALAPDALRKRLAGYSPEVQKEAGELYAALDAAAAGQRAKLEELLAHLSGGDVRRGQAVFNGSKAACSACHAIGYLGGNVGPDLTRIGKIRSERDLLESIVFPSASFVRSYEPVLVTTKDGKSYNGLIRKDTPEELTLATGLNQEVRIVRTDVEEIQPGKVSVMPAGLDQQLTPAELADLVAFLKACQ